MAIDEYHDDNDGSDNDDCTDNSDKDRVDNDDVIFRAFNIHQDIAYETRRLFIAKSRLSIAIVVRTTPPVGKSMYPAISHVCRKSINRQARSADENQYRVSTTRYCNRKYILADIDS